MRSKGVLDRSEKVMKVYYIIIAITIFFIAAEPLSMSPQKALEQIGNQLQKQYERWQPRARYKQLLDPTTDDVRKLCVALRKNAKVFHT